MPAYFMDHRFDVWKVPSPAPVGEGTRPAGGGEDPFAIPSPAPAEFGARHRGAWRPGLRAEAARRRAGLVDSFTRVPGPRPAFARGA